MSLDSFRDASYSEPYIYVLDPKTGKTKTVIDRFYSFVWTERYMEAGEFELSGPEKELWTEIIEEGDYLQFSHSDILKQISATTSARDGGEEGRYTMIVEQRFTEWDSETGYTVVAKGRSLECLLDRRVNLGVGPEAIQYTLEGRLVGSNVLAADPEVAAGGYGLGIQIEDGPQWPPGKEEYYENYYYPQKGEGYYKTGFSTGDIRWDDSAAHKLNNLVHEVYLQEQYGRTYECVLLELLDYNCGAEAIKNRQFENFTVEHIVPMRNDDGSITYHYGPGTGHKPEEDLSNIGHRVEEVYDGKMESVYDIMTELIAKCDDSKGGLGFKIVGSTRQLHPFDEETVFEMKFVLYMGEDLTIDGPYKNQGDKVVIFSRNWDNLESMNYIHGMENYRNVCYQDTGLESEPEDLWDIRQQLEAIDKRQKELDNQDTDLRREQDRIKEPTDAQKKDFEARQKAIDDENEKLNKEQERLEKLQDDWQKKYDRMGHKSFYYGVYPRRADKYSLYPDYPKGLDRRECYNSDSPPTPATDDFEYNGRARYKFVKWEQYEVKERKVDAKPGDESDEAYNTYQYWRSIDVHADWDEFSQRCSELATTFLHKDDNSKEDDVEASVNFNAIYQPIKDYRVGDIVTVMGIHRNETVRKMRCDEMVYTIDQDGFTIVPTFSILPLKDDDAQ